MSFGHREVPSGGERVLAASASSVFGQEWRITAVRRWLFCLATMVVLMVAVGGATRLTGSGLSITEWRPVTGIIPPLSGESWLIEFEKYRQSSQYQLLNSEMDLAGFKGIYLWEWAHRLIGRLTGLVFFIPFFWFLGRGYLSRSMAFKLAGLGALGAMQGAVGWIMVASGLEPGMIAVAPLKLMAHLVLASLILMVIVHLAAGLRPKLFSRVSARLNRQAAFLPWLVLVQVALGAMVAGTKAGLVYNTWPLMDGDAVPLASKLFIASPWIENFIDNALLVQFNHRAVAYVIVALTFWHAICAIRSAPGTSFATRAAMLGFLAIGQMFLGITILMTGLPLGGALLHQVLAMVLLIVAVMHAVSVRNVDTMSERVVRSLGTVRP